MPSKSSPQVSVGDVQDLFSQAQLSKDATSIVVANLNASAAALAACQGVEATQLGATEATIVVFVADSSGSMSEVSDEVRQSIGESVGSMVESKQSAALTLTLVTFNEAAGVCFANKPVEEIQDSDILYQAGG